MINNYKKYLELFLGIYPLFVIFFILLDFITFSIFNLEVGFLISIISRINITSYNFIFLYMLIIFLGVIISHYIANWIINKVYSTIKLSILIHLLIISIIYLTIFLSIIFLITYIEISIQSFVLSYIIILLILIILDLISTIAHNLLSKYFRHPVSLFYYSLFLIYLLLLLFCSKILLDISSTALSVLVFLAISFHGLSITFTDVLSNQINHKDIYKRQFTRDNRLNRSKYKLKKINFFFVIITIIIAFLYLDSAVNINSWKLPMNINKKFGFTDGTFNLIFNKGFLINSHDNNIKINVPRKYEEDLYFHIDHILKEYTIDKKCNKFSVGVNSKYIDLGNNLKLYFKNNNDFIEDTDEILVFLIEEKKLSNKEGTIHNLISMSKYNINE